MALTDIVRDLKAIREEGPKALGQVRRVSQEVQAINQDAEKIARNIAGVIAQPYSTISPQDAAALTALRTGTGGGGGGSAAPQPVVLVGPGGRPLTTESGVLRTSDPANQQGVLTTSDARNPPGTITTSTPINDFTAGTQRIDPFGRIPPLLRGVLFGEDRVVGAPPRQHTFRTGTGGGGGGGSPGGSFQNAGNFGVRSAGGSFGPSAGERSIIAAINNGFKSMGQTLGKTGRSDGGAIFRAREEF